MKRLSLAVFLLVGCGGEPDILDAHFLDEVVGAPARTAEVTVLESPTCEELLAVQASAIDQLGTPIALRKTGFPINPDDNVLDGLPRGRPIIIHVVALDEDGLVVGRGCEVVSLDAKGPLDVKVELRALPKCEVDPRFLDIAIVLDTSTEFAVTFPASEHIDLIRDVIVDSMEQGTSYSIVTHGHTLPPEEILAPTADKMTAGSGLTTLRNATGERVELFTAVTLATRLLRSRAVCRRRPAILIVEAGADSSTNNIPVTEAQIGVYATQGDTSDDIFVFGVYASLEARDDILELFEPLSPGLVGTDGGDGTAATLQRGLQSARFAFDGLIVR